MRELTANERAVLAHIVVDPDEWWSHANSVVKVDHEAALEAKVGVVGERAGGDAGSPVGEMVAVGRVEMVDPLVACAEEMG